MGVAGAALWSIAALVTGALATAWIERRMVGAGEAGPAAPIRPDALDVERRDPWLYPVAPVVALVGACWAMVVIPFSRRAIGADLGIGAFYYVVVLDFAVLAIALGGWGADTRSGVEAAYRAVAQLVAYVVPLGLGVIGPVMMARSLSTLSITAAQERAGLWYVVPQPLGFALYVATALAQTYRAPFLEPFADSIDRGVLGVYGGWAGLLWKIALSGILFVAAAMGAVLYLGGPSGPWLPGPVWMIAKTLAVLALLVWAGRRARPRSTAELLSLSWKVLIPVGLVNVLVVGIEILLGVGQAPFGGIGGR